MKRQTLLTYLYAEQSKLERAISDEFSLDTRLGLRAELKRLRITIRWVENKCDKEMER